ncbi:hypothetical protein DFH27DRAFT_574124 [Peziza echinospora]|nr:hypothetical protein DFH27DRAFT_574124 [Peziza echinospora]
MASHGTPRSAYSKSLRTAALRAEELEKIAEYNALVGQVQEARRKADYTPEALQLTSTLLKFNPEFVTGWNYRREILLRGTLNPPVAEDGSGGPTPQLLHSTIQQELAHLFPILKSHPKCYALWNHRRWLLDLPQTLKLEPEGGSAALWETELMLTTHMLARDSRNFHGWTYRRIVVEEIERRNNGETGDLTEKEFAYTTAMITANMSNFSAWHSRSKLIGRLLKKRGAGKQDRMDFLEDELSLLKKAILTKPGDQSLWFYHRWLVYSNASPKSQKQQQSSNQQPQQSLLQEQTIAPNLSHSTKLALVESEIDDLTDMLYSPTAPESPKWILAALVGLVGLARRLRNSVPLPGEEVKDEEDGEEEDDEDEEGEGIEPVNEVQEMKRVREWMARLIEIDGEDGKGRRWKDLEAHLKPEGW